jgi:hypothetical protein
MNEWMNVACLAVEKDQCLPLPRKTMPCLLFFMEFGNSVTRMLPACLQHGIWPISFLLLLRLDVHVDGDLVMSISREREISLVSNQKYPSIQIANGALESKWRVCQARHGEESGVCVSVTRTCVNASQCHGSKYWHSCSALVLLRVICTCISHSCWWRH